MRILLADLGHNLLTVSSDIYPLGVANLAAYAREYVTSKEPVDVSIYREPEDLKAALEEKPDLVGFSSYAWNFELSLRFAEYTKQKWPGALTIMGGPHFPLTREEQEEFLRSEQLQNIDVATRGPTYEGERAFQNIVQRLVDVGGNLEGVFDEPVPGNIWIDPRTQEFVVGDELPRILDLDEIPSPYLTGLMDPFYETGYMPMMQIAKGCPFTCSFCNSAVAENSKIYRHSIENVKADLDHVAARVKPEVALAFADDNFGMYPEDEEIADYIGHLQKTTGWPQYIRTTTGKNKHDRIIRVIEKTGGALPMTAAVQSMNPEVLTNIGRANIKLDAYTKVQEKTRQYGIQSYGELILSLPGETKETFMKGIEDLMDSGVQRVSAHQLMLLHGAPLANPDSREKWGFETKFRVVARNIGKYIDENPIIEVDEIVVNTPTFPFEDYIDARVFHLLLTIFFYEGNFQEAFELANQYGIKTFDVMKTLHEMLDEAPEAFRHTVSEYTRENNDLLFDSREECQAWGAEHYDGLVDGSIGGNLLSKYSMLGRYYVCHEGLEFLHKGIRAAIAKAGKEVDDAELDAVISYLEGPAPPRALSWRLSTPRPSGRRNSTWKHGPATTTRSRWRSTASSRRGRIRPRSIPSARLCSSTASRPSASTRTASASSRGRCSRGTCGAASSA